VIFVEDTFPFAQPLGQEKEECFQPSPCDAREDDPMGLWEHKSSDLGQQVAQLDVSPTRPSLASPGLNAQARLSVPDHEPAAEARLPQSAA